MSTPRRIGGAIERRADDPPIEREGEGGAERAAVPVGLGEGDEGAALGGDRRFALRRARGAGRAAGGDRELGQHPALVGHRVGRFAEPGAGGGLGRAQGGELDHAGVAAVQHAQEMDRVGDVAGTVHRIGREPGMGGAALDGDAGGDQRSGAAALGLQDRT